MASAKHDDVRGVTFPDALPRGGCDLRCVKHRA
jgi:hypothetical protein